MTHFRMFLRSGHAPTLFAAFLYFAFSCCTWVLNGAMAPFISESFHLSPAQKGLMLSVPIIAGALFRFPLGGLLEQKVEDAGKELQCIKTTLLASMQGYAPQVAIEFGRKVLYSLDRPTFVELESHVKGKK